MPTQRRLYPVAGFASSRIRRFALAVSYVTANSGPRFANRTGIFHPQIYSGRIFDVRPVLRTELRGRIYPVAGKNSKPVESIFGGKTFLPNLAEVGSISPGSKAPLLLY